MGELRVTMNTGAEGVLGEGVVDALRARLRGPLLRAGDAGRRDGAHRRRQAEGLCLTVQLAPKYPRLGTHCPRDGIDTDALQA